MSSKFAPIKNYIPQREPFIMVSELVKVTENEAYSKLNISNDNLLSENGFFQEAGLIENIAQTAAAMTGFNAVANNTEVKKGYIGAVKNLKIYKLPEVNSCIMTSIIIVNQVMNVHIVNGKIEQDGEIMAECELRIFLDE